MDQAVPPDLRPRSPLERHPGRQTGDVLHRKRWPGFFQDDLSKVLSLVADGKIEAHASTRMPLEEAAEALGFLASGRVSGKVVLVPESDARQSS